jgi:chromosome segregation ATPase
MRQLGEAMSAKQAVELRDAHIAHAAMLQQLEARYKSELQDVQNACTAKLVGLRDEHLRESRLRMNESRREMDELKVTALHEKEFAVRAEKEALSLQLAAEHNTVSQLKQQLTGLEFELREAQEKATAKKQACVALEDSLQRKSEEVTRLQREQMSVESSKKGAQELQQSCDELQLLLDAKCAALEAAHRTSASELEDAKQTCLREMQQAKLERSGEIQSLKEELQLLKETVAQLRQEKEYLASVVEKSKCSLRGQWQEVEEVRRQGEARQAAENKALEVELAGSREECESLQKELLRTQECCMRLEDAKLEALETCSNMKAELNLAHGQIAMCEEVSTEKQAELEVMKSSLQHAQTGLAAREEDCRKSEVLLKECKDSVRILQGSEKDLSAAKAAAHDKLDVEGRRNDALKQKLQEFVGVMKELKEVGFACLQRQLEEAEQELSLVREACWGQEQELVVVAAAQSKLRFELEAAKHDSIAKERVLKDRLAAAAQEYAHQALRREKMLHQKNTQHTAEIQQRDARLQSVTNQAAEERQSQKARIEALQNTETACLGRIQDLDSTIAELRGQVRRRGEDIDAKESEVKAMLEAVQSAGESATMKLKDARDAAWQVEMERDLLKESCSQLLDRESTYTREIDELRGEVEARRAAERKWQDVHEQTVRECDLQLSELGQKCWAAGVERDAMRQELKTSREEALRLRDTVSSLQEASIAALQEVQTVREECQAHKERLVDLEDSLRIQTSKQSLAQQHHGAHMADRETLRAPEAGDICGLHSSSSVARSSLGQVRVMGALSNDNDRKQRELERSLTRLISENSDFRRGESSLRRQVILLDKMLVLMEGKLVRLQDDLFFGVVFAGWRDLLSSSGAVIQGDQNDEVEYADGLASAASSEHVPERTQQHTDMLEYSVNPVAKLKRRSFQFIAAQPSYSAALQRAGAAVQRLVPRLLLQQMLKRWLCEVDSSCRRRMIMMHMGIRWTQVSLHNAVADLRRNRLVARSVRKLATSARRKYLTALVQGWFLHSRSQTIGAKFLRAGEKSITRTGAAVTGAAANVTGAAVSAISYVNPGNWSPFSTPEAAVSPEFAAESTRLLARNLPYSNAAEFAAEVSRPSSIKPPIFE